MTLYEGTMIFPMNLFLSMNVSSNIVPPTRINLATYTESREDSHAAISNGTGFAAL